MSAVNAVKLFSIEINENLQRIEANSLSPVKELVKTIRETVVPIFQDIEEFFKITDCSVFMPHILSKDFIHTYNRDELLNLAEKIPTLFAYLSEQYDLNPSLKTIDEQKPPEKNIKVIYSFASLYASWFEILLDTRPREASPEIQKKIQELEEESEQILSEIRQSLSAMAGEPFLDNATLDNGIQLKRTLQEQPLTHTQFLQIQAFKKSLEQFLEKALQFSVENSKDDFQPLHNLYYDAIHNIATCDTLLDELLNHLVKKATLLEHTSPS